MSHHPPSALPPSQSSSYTPFSPPNDPADSLHQPKERPHQPLPLSPPTTSGSPSLFDASGPSSPYPSTAYTPASAPLMSADPSQQGFSPVSETPLNLVHPSLDDDQPRSRTIDDRDTPRSEHSTEHRTSSKHRLPEDATPADAERSKRRRTDHDRQDEHHQDEMDGPTNSEKAFGAFYKVSSMPISISRPHPALNLLSLYGLDPLSASVARKDPITGEKINKLRKSYEGKIKDLPGRNKATSKEHELFNLLNYPPDEWEIHRVHGKDLSAALSPDEQNLSDDFMAKLGSALNMAPTPLPARENEHWRNIIDLENTALKPGNAPTQGPAKTENTRSGSQAASPTAEPLRPRRRGTKRNYHDESFEGYEDFPDELGDNMSIDDDDRKSTTSSTAKKKRRKENGSAPHFSGSMSQFSPSTVSVGGNGSR